MSAANQDYIFTKEYAVGFFSIDNWKNVYDCSGELGEPKGSESRVLQGNVEKANRRASDVR